MKRKISYLCARFFSIVNIFIPKKENLILFYDSMNSVLWDNTEAIYSYIEEKDINKKYKKIVFLSKNERNKLKCIWYFLRAKYIFLSFGDLRIKPTQKQIIVNQWHGAPIKSIGKLTKCDDYHREKLDNFTYCICTSDLFKPVFEKAFGCSTEKVVVLGQARNDYLFKNFNIDEYWKEFSNYKKKIIWMPTFRVSKDKRFKDSSKINEETMLPIFEKKGDLEKLNLYLKEENILLVIKIHAHADFKDLEYSNIKFLTNDDLINKKVRLYEFINAFDALITDYSSVFVDFYLINKMVAFTMDDYDDYLNNRGFSVSDPKQYMIGKHIYIIDDFYEFINDVKKNNDEYSPKRKEVSKLLNKYEDNLNCERLVKLCGIEF